MGEETKTIGPKGRRDVSVMNASSRRSRPRAHVVLTPRPSTEPGIVSPRSLTEPASSPALLLFSSIKLPLANKLDDMPSLPTDPPLSLLPRPPCSYWDEIEFILSLLALAWVVNSVSLATASSWTGERLGEDLGDCLGEDPLLVPDDSSV